MLFRSFRLFRWTGVLALAASGSAAFAQCRPCNPCCPVRATPCYRTIPVTEVRECRQTVQRPVIETTYVDQPITEYRQVVETKTAEVPTCTYQNVTEMKTVQRDCGRWVTQCYSRPQVTPCQYDNRPDLFGFINRTGYAVRMAFTPQTWTEKTYVPNVVTTQVPVSRQVAVRGTRTVNYQVCRTVPVTTTRKVAVNTVRMVSEEVVTRQPVTVYKTVPWGSSLAQGIPNSVAKPTATAALQPAPESKPTAIMPKNSGEATKITQRVKENLNEPDDSVDRGAPGGDKTPRKPTGPCDDQGASRPAPSAGTASPTSESEVEQEYALADRPIGVWVARKRRATTTAGPIIRELAQLEAKPKK